MWVFMQHNNYYVGYNHNSKNYTKMLQTLKIHRKLISIKYFNFPSLSVLKD